MMAPTVVLRDVEVDGRRCDVRVRGDVIEAIGAPGSLGGDDVIDGGGGGLIPGLHDHHIHLRAAAAARLSVRAGPPDVTDRSGLVAALGRPGTGWLRAVGYHESVAGELDRWVLDVVVAERPVRVQHRSGALWVLNSAGLREAGIGDRPAAGEPGGIERTTHGVATGRLFRLDAWLAPRLPAVALPLGEVGRDLMRAGVTGVTDATPYEHASDLAALAAAAAADLPQRLVAMGGPSLRPPLPSPLEPGPAKILLPDHELPPLAEIVDMMSAARATGRPVAVHCVTVEALVLTIAALREVGQLAGDRIEHGAVIPETFVPDLVELGVCVVTEPGFVADRGDEYLRDVDPTERPFLWRGASLRRAGIPLAAGTDAPFGDADPWRSIAAAIERRTRSGQVVGPGDRLSPLDALALFLGSPDDPGGPPRRVEVGAPADLCLLDRPLAAALERPSSDHVAAVLINGRVHPR